MRQSARAARRTIAHRSATTRAQARIRRNGTATLTTHGIAAGLTATQARSVAGSLRKAAKTLAITGTEGVAFRKGGRRDCRRYTPAEVAAMALTYRPRKPAYRTARQHMLAA